MQPCALFSTFVPLLSWTTFRPSTELSALLLHNLPLILKPALKANAQCMCITFAAGSRSRTVLGPLTPKTVNSDGYSRDSPKDVTLLNFHVLQDFRSYMCVDCPEPVLTASLVWPLSFLLYPPSGALWAICLKLSSHPLLPKLLDLVKCLFAAKFITSSSQVQEHLLPGCFDSIP